MKGIEKNIDRANDLVETIDPSQVVSVLGELRDSTAGVKLRQFFDTMSGEDRDKLYTYGKPSAWGMATSFGVPGMIRSALRYDDTKLKFIGGNIAPSYRLLVHRGVIDAPDISSQELLTNIASDAKSIKSMIRALELFATVIAPESKPLIYSLKHASSSSIAAAEKIAIESTKLTRKEIYEKRRDLSEALLMYVS